MNTDLVAVNRVEWAKLFPGIHLWNSVRMAFRIRILILVAVLMLFSTVEPQELFDAESGNTSAQTITARRHRIQRATGDLPFDIASQIGHNSVEVVVPEQIATIVSSTGSLLHHGSRFQFLLLTWNMLLVGIFGVAIARSTATEFCRSSRTGPIAAIKYSANRLLAMLLASFLAIGLVALVVVPLALAGMASEAQNWVAQLSWFCWPVILVLAIVAILAASTMVIGWWLSLGAIGTDDCSGADALSRGVNYFLSHKLLALWYLFQVVLASLIAKLIGWGIVGAASSLIASRMPNVFARFRPPIKAATDIPEVVLLNTQTMLQQLPNALQLAAFLSGLTLMYVLLRQKEDAVNLTEIDGAAKMNSAH
ncbi:MAG: hypothetical protein WAO83_01920 [Fuerstiella sp.]